ncbi:hypothetical protein V6N11_025632 [Hibiscus sabdariffa]|uniref:Uncharacterized protein n=1 Tax=Hibiscus sabdariffa TaxID=183260 RepID=A0ABR2STL4_9ROSI
MQGQDGVHSTPVEGLQSHGDGMPTGGPQDTGGTSPLGHSRGDTGVILTDGEMVTDAVVSSDSKADEGFNEAVSVLGEEANEISTGDGTITDVVPPSELEPDQNNNMNSDNDVHCDMGTTMSPRQDDVLTTQPSSNRHHMLTGSGHSGKLMRTTPS